MLTRDELLELAGEMVNLRFFMAVAFATLEDNRKRSQLSRPRMRRLAELEEKLRAAAKEMQ